MTPTLRMNILRGDCRDLISGIDDESVGLIITDPPYAKTSNWAFEFLYKEASRVLCDGGSLVFLLGHAQMPNALSVSFFDLRYWWIGWLNHNRSNRMFGKNVIIKGKPFLWFVKGTRRKTQKVPFDTLSFSKNEWKESKSFHKWGQPKMFAGHIVEFLAIDGKSVLDPFAGSGSFVVAAEELGFKSLGFEIEEGEGLEKYGVKGESEDE